MKKCDEHWCEHFGQQSSACGSCIKKESNNDNTDVRVILKRRQEKQMKLDQKKSKGQKR